MITSSTVHPYFWDTFDVVRLHDTYPLRAGQEVFPIMKARADLARAVLPHAPIDADDWINRHYKEWLDYTLDSHRLGIPCTLYAERFVLSWESEPTFLEIPFEDLQRIGRRWREVLG